MAKRCMIEKEKRRTKQVKRYAKRRDELRMVIRDQNATLEEKMVAQNHMQHLPRDSNRCRMRNRCLITGRSRGVYRRFGLCRHKLREYAMEGLIPGLRKASW
jgi:small subunit ribosomal protein S14